MLITLVALVKNQQKHKITNYSAKYFKGPIDEHLRCNVNIGVLISTDINVFALQKASTNHIVEDYGSSRLLFPSYANISR